MVKFVGSGSNDAFEVSGIHDEISADAGAGFDSLKLTENVTVATILLAASSGLEELDITGFHLRGTDSSDTFNLSGITDLKFNRGDFWGSELENEYDLGRAFINLAAGNDVFIGSAATDWVRGGLGDDTILGGAGDDLIVGDAGDDTLYGGAGNDVFFNKYDSGNDIIHGGDGIDTYRVFGEVRVSKLYLNASAGVEYFQFSPSHLTDFGNTDLNGTSGDDIFDLSGITAVIFAEGYGCTFRLEDGNDIFLGTPDDDVVNGGIGDDRLEGAGGDDRLDGGAGLDLLAGGNGNDTYIVDNEGDSVTEQADQGTDLVYSSANFTLANHIEKLTLTGSKAVNGTGNSAANTIAGNSGANVLNGGAGDDVLYGGVGDDTLIGGAGSDALRGGSGVDTVSYSDSRKGVTASLTKPSTNTNDAKGDVYDAIENLSGSAYSDKLTGHAANNVLRGRGGNDELYGDKGADHLYGGGGNDIFVFKAVSDSISSTDGRDIIFDFEHGDRIDLSAIDANAGASGNQAFTFIGSNGYHKKAGELRAYQKNGDTFVTADVNGDGQTDFAVQIDKLITLTKSDFLL